VSLCRLQGPIHICYGIISVKNTDRLEFLKLLSKRKRCKFYDRKNKNNEECLWLTFDEYCGSIEAHRQISAESKVK